VTCCDQNPNGPDTPLPSGVKNVQWDWTRRAAFQLEEVSSLDETSSFVWRKSPGVGQDRPSRSGAVAEAEVAFNHKFPFCVS